MAEGSEEEEEGVGVGKVGNLAMALTATNDAPRIRIVDGQILRSTLFKGIVKGRGGPARLLPRTGGVAQEHAQQVARTLCVLLAGGGGGATTAAAAVCGPSVHDGQIVHELNVALAPAQLVAVFAG